MSKAQFYDPKQLRAPGEIHFQDIDVCKYQKTVADELKGDSFTKEDMLRIYRDMEYIREFESMLKSVRLTKAYNGVEYTYTGPAHLYTGEESAAVGQSYLLDSNDFIFGTHRSHGEVLAKGLSAITKMSDEELLHIMETTFDGKPYEVVKKHLPEKSVKEQAIVFFLYGLTCELFGRENGFARGLGNSMHLFFLPFGIYPNNAIVGGAIPKEYIPAIDAGIQGAMLSGVLAGYPVVDVKVTLYDGSYHEVDSSEMAFKIAGSMAFKEACRKANAVLLEPIMKVCVIVPDEYMGDVIGDLNARRGQIQGYEMRSGAQQIDAFVPLSEMFGYATNLRSRTQGRGQYTMEPSHYIELPKGLQEKLINKRTGRENF